MKHLSALILVTSLFSPSLSAELEGDIPWGLEAVTGARTGYAYRGFDLQPTFGECHFPKGHSGLEFYQKTLYRYMYNIP